LGKCYGTLHHSLQQAKEDGKDLPVNAGSTAPEYNAPTMSNALILSVLFLGPLTLLASETPATQNLLDVAKRQAALLSDSDRPFVMDVDFTVQLLSPTQGHLRLRWAAKDRWWSRVSMGKFEQVEFQTGERTYTSRNIDFTPRQIAELMDLLHVDNTAYEKVVVRSDNERTEGGVRMDCLAVQIPDKVKHPQFEVCVDSTTHDITSWMEKYDNYSRDIVYRKQFSDFAPFGGHRYPRKFEKLKDGHLIMSASVTDLQESPLDPKLLIPPAGAIERRTCPGEKAPEMLDQASVEYDFHIRGPSETVLQITVQADGTISNVQIVGTEGKAQIDAVMAAIKQTKFKPAMCGTEPVVADMYVSYEFDTPFIK